MKRRAASGKTDEVPSPPSRRGLQGRHTPVYAIDIAGNIVRKYPGIRAAAAYVGHAEIFVWGRANGRIRGNEFTPDGVTFRYADQWDAMTPAQRRADVDRASRRREKH